MAIFKESIQELFLSYINPDSASTLVIDPIMDSPRCTELCTYLVKQQPNRQELSEAISRFLIAAVTTESFREERYKTETSPHLQKPSEEYPELFEAWKGLEFAASLQESTQKPQMFSFEEFLNDKISHHHLPQELIEALQSTEKEITPELFECLHYLEECKSLEGSPNKEKVEQGIALFKRHYPSCEFINDLKSLLPKRAKKGAR